MQATTHSVALVITHRTRSGQRDAVRAIWMRHMAPAIAQNPGHLAYCYGFDATEPDVICAFQQYASPAAAQAFLTHPNYLAYLHDVEPLLEGPPHVRQLVPQWTKLPS